MGFQDGSLRASLVVTNAARAADNEAMPNVTFDISKATTLLQLSANEPFISLQLLPPPSGSTTFSITAPVLICVGALGTMVTLSSSPLEPGKKNRVQTPKFAIENLLMPCGGRWISMACIGYRFLDKGKDLVSSRSLDFTPSIVLSFVGVNDSRRTFLHRLSLPANRQSKNKVNDVGCGRNSYRLPIPSRMASSIHAVPGPLCASYDHSSMHIIFTISAPNGKAVVMRMLSQAPSFELRQDSVANS